MRTSVVCAELTRHSNVGNLAPYSVPLSIICVAVVWGTEPHAMTWTTRRALGRAINAFAALLQRMEMGSLGLGSLLGAQPSSGPAFAMERLEDRVTAAFAASAVAGPIVFLSGPDDIRRIVESVTPADMAATLMASVTETEFATSDDGQDAMASAALSAVGRMPGQLLSALTDEDTPAGLPSQILLKRRAQLRAACDSGLHLRLLSLYKGDDSSAANVLGSRARIGRGPKHKHIAFVHTAFEQLWTHTSVDQRVQLAEAGLLDALASRAAYFVTMSDSIVSSFGASARSGSVAEGCSRRTATELEKHGRRAHRALGRCGSHRLAHVCGRAPQSRHGVHLRGGARPREPHAQGGPRTIRARAVE